VGVITVVVRAVARQEIQLMGNRPIRKPLLRPLIWGCVVTAMLPAFLFNWLFALLMLPLPTEAYRNESASQFAFLVLPMVLSCGIHWKVHQLQWPTLYGLLSLIPIISSLGVCLLNIAIQETRLVNCQTPWCDQQPMVLEISQTITIIQHGFNALAVAGLGGIYWLITTTTKNKIAA
jgi:hypothetical protein